MYSFIISSTKGTWDQPFASIDPSRFLEYTDSALKVRLGDLNKEVIAELCKIPAVFAYELEVGELARVGSISGIRKRQREIRVTFRFDSAIQPFASELIREHLWEFDLDDFELSRSHWAVKDVDLWDALASVGVFSARAAENNTIKLSRRATIAASHALRYLDHADFDHMLLEFGVADLNVGREFGGLKARSNALAQFAVTFPEALTADGKPIGLAIVEHVIRSNLAEQSLRAALENDGYIIADDKLETLPNKPNMTKVGLERKVSASIPNHASLERSNEDMGAITSAATGPQRSGILVNPTVFDIPSGGVQPSLVGVMMPFDAAFDEVYEVIKESCSAASLLCKRADDMWEYDKVFDDIINLIFSSRIIVVDFSTRNPNVMYETGIAHLLGKSVIPIVQNSSDVPFDLQPIRYIHYHNNRDGRDELKTKLIVRLQTLAKL